MAEETSRSDPSGFPEALATCLREDAIVRVAALRLALLVARRLAWRAWSPRCARLNRPA